MANIGTLSLFDLHTTSSTTTDYMPQPQLHTDTNSIYWNSTSSILSPSRYIELYNRNPTLQTSPVKSQYSLISPPRRMESVPSSTELSVSQQNLQQLLRTFKQSLLPVPSLLQSNNDQSTDTSITIPVTGSTNIVNTKLHDAIQTIRKRSSDASRSPQPQISSEVLESQIGQKVTQLSRCTDANEFYELYNEIIILCQQYREKQKTVQSFISDVETIIHEFMTVQENEITTPSKKPKSELNSIQRTTCTPQRTLLGIQNTNVMRQLDLNSVASTNSNLITTATAVDSWALPAAIKTPDTVTHQLLHNSNTTKTLSPQYMTQSSTGSVIHSPFKLHNELSRTTSSPMLISSPLFNKPPIHAKVLKTKQNSTVSSGSNSGTNSLTNSPLISGPLSDSTPLSPELSQFLAFQTHDYRAKVLRKPQRPRRQIDDMHEAEKWYCPLQCGQVYKTTSTKSIKAHTEKCAGSMRALSIHCRSVSDTTC